MIDPAFSFEAVTHWNTKGRQASRQTDSDLRDSRHARENTQKTQTHGTFRGAKKKPLSPLFFADSKHEGFSENKRRGGNRSRTEKKRSVFVCTHCYQRVYVTGNIMITAWWLSLNFLGLSTYRKANLGRIDFTHTY